MSDTRLASFSCIIYLILMVKNSWKVFQKGKKKKKFWVFLKDRVNKLGKEHKPILILTSFYQ